jgi:hypothetical protein
MAYKSAGSQFSEILQQCPEAAHLPDRRRPVYLNPYEDYGSVNGECLLALGLKPKSVVRSSWSAAQEHQLLSGISALTSGSQQTPTPAMDIGYWLSLHVMDCQFTVQECLCKVWQLKRKLDIQWAPVAQDDKEGDALSNRTIDNPAAAGDSND